MYFLGLKLHEAADFVSDLGAYKVKEEALQSGLFVTELDDLLMSSVMHIYKHEGCMYICPREDPDQRSFIDFVKFFVLLPCGCRFAH